MSPRPTEENREKHQTDTRTLLLQSAIAEFSEKGYHRANVDTISQQAGFAKGTIYNYFSSKRELMLALIEEISREHITFIQNTVMQAESPSLRLEKFFEAGFQYVSEHLQKGLVMVNNLYSPDQEFKMTMFISYQPLFQLLAEAIIQPGIEAGEFRPVDPAQTSALLMNIYLGTASQADPNGQPWIKHQDVADFATHALRVSA